MKDAGLQRFKAEELDRLHLKLFGFARPKPGVDRDGAA